MKLSSRALRFALASTLVLFTAFCGGTSVVDATSGAGGAAASTATSASAEASAGNTTGSTGAGGPNFAACDAPGTCVLANKTCCGVCGKPTVNDLDAIGEAAIDAHAKAVCPEPGPCPACETELNGNLFAYCDLDAKSCVGANLPDTAFAACKENSDCSLRLGVGCCECIQAGEWVAVATARLADLSALLCKADQPCPNCVPQPPNGIMAACVGGRCEVKPLLPD